MADHYDNAEAAAAAALAFLAPQYAPFGKTPRVYAFEACGLNVVCLPWGHTKQNLAMKRIGEVDTLVGKLAYAEARFTDTIWYVDGQQEPGRTGALKWAKGLADLGDEYANLIYEIAGTSMRMEGEGPKK